MATEKLTKEQQEQINAMTARYVERLQKRAADGKELKVERSGRVPSDVADDKRDEYVELRDQLVQLKNLRQESVKKLRDLREAMEALRTRKPKAKKAKK